VAKTVSGIDIELTDKQRDALVEMAPGLRASEALSGLATGLLQDLAGGGAMLSPGAVRRLANSVDDAFNEQQIIDMVEKGAKRFGQAECVEYVIDPIYITPMRDHAKSNGRTMQSLVQDCMSIAFEQGWFYEIPPHKTLALTEEQYESIRSALGKTGDDPLFGADVAEFVMQAATEPEPVV
jgi:hypothetical protein